MVEGFVRIGSDDSDLFGGVPDLGRLNFIKAGPGVVGRTSVVAALSVLLSAIAIWAVRDSPALVMSIFVLSMIGVAGFVLLAFRYADRHPNHAVMEGGQHAELARASVAAGDKGVIDGTAKIVANEPPTSLTEGRGLNE